MERLVIQKILSFCLLIIILPSCLFQINREGKYILKDLRKEVYVYTDKYGIPHIKAQNDFDMMYALGYVTASERLWQMDLLRRVGSGRLSEIFGEKLLKTDILFRKLMIRRRMTENWKHFKKTIPDLMKMQIKAYFLGVNEYIRTGPLPLEMRILKYKPEPFDMVDALSIAGYMATTLTDAFTVDPLYTDLSKELSPKEIDLLFPHSVLESDLKGFSHSYPPKRKLRKSAVAQKEPQKEPQEKPQKKNQNIPPVFSSDYYKNVVQVINDLKKTLPVFHGSNSWVLSGERTKSGYPILANDPHVDFSSPSIFFEAHIKSLFYEDYGHYIPGVPFPILAHNKKRAWAITMSLFNDIDFYREKFHPKDSKKVLYNGMYVNVQIFEEDIQIKEGQTHKEKIIVTPHGPIIDGTPYVKKGQALALKWQFLSPDNNPVLSFFLLSRSQTLEDLAPALSHTAAPGFNVSFVDSQGNIGWHVMGKIPVLQKHSSGRQILEGSTGQDEYKRYLSIEEHPHIYNPPSGQIVSANYRPPVKGPIPWVGLWQPQDRFVRIEHLLKRRQKWDLQSLKKIQTDETVHFYKHYKKNFLFFVKPRNPLEKEAFKIIRQWKGKSRQEDIAPSIYYATQRALLQNLIRDELGITRFKAYTQGGDVYAFLYYILDRKNSVLWDNIETENHKEHFKDIINQSFYEAVEILSKKMGPAVKQWKWSKIHKVEFQHALGKSFPLNKILNLGPFPVGGGTSQINNMGEARGSSSFYAVYGPATRRLIDMAHPQISYGILPTGNSGHVSSFHYADQISLYLKGDYRIQHMDFDFVNSKTQRMTLIPAF